MAPPDTARRSGLAHVETWVFDLDHTLYPPDGALFRQIEARMTAFLMRELGLDHAEAEARRTRWWRAYGASVVGLREEHGVAPEGFLEEVHDIDFSVLAPDPGLVRAVEALPGRRIVFTNGARRYAGRVLEAIGLSGAFDAVYGAEDAGLAPKPTRAAYDRVFGREAFDPRRAAMFEDDPRNLVEPAAMGLATIHVAPEPATADHIHHGAPDLTGFLSRIV